MANIYEVLNEHPRDWHSTPLRRFYVLTWPFSIVGLFLFRLATAIFFIIRLAFEEATDGIRRTWRGRP